VVDHQDPIRQQLIEARRNQILDAAARVFADRGYHRATTKHIAQQAGVSEGTIYNYFDSKGDLLIGIVKRLSSVDTMGTELAEALNEDARAALLAIARYRMAMIDRDFETVQAVLPEMLVNAGLRGQFYDQFARPTAVLLEQYMQSRVKLGAMRSVDAPLVVRSVQGMFIGLMLLRILGDDLLTKHWNDLAEVVVGVLLDGLDVKEEAA